MSETTTRFGWRGVVSPQRQRLMLVAGWPLVATWLALVAVFVNFLLIFWVTSMQLNMYVAQPLLWCSVGALALLARRNDEGRIGLTADRWLIGGAMLVGLLQVVLLWLAGFMASTFGHSPYSRQLLYIALNMWFVGTRLAALELARWQLVKALGKRRALLGGAFVWLLLTLASLPLRGFTDLSGGGGTLDFLGGIVVPVAGQNMLATYLVAVGGPFVSMAYMGTLQLFEWIPPILPNLHWTLALFIGVAVPAIGLMVMRDLKGWRETSGSGPHPSPLPEGEGETTAASGSGISTLWVVAAAGVVFLIWFNTGLFGVRPALVSGQSMQPTLCLGDVVVTRPIATADVKVGDVIWYQRGSLAVIHRVIKIENQNGQTVFTTKGDNNNAADPPVRASQVDGELVAVIPKVGWIGIGVKSLFGLVR